MATALTPDGRDKLARHLFGYSSTSFPGAGQCYISLHSAAPGDAGSSQISSGRTQVTLSYDGGNKWFTNASAISVAAVSGSIQWYALWHSPGTGNVWFQGALGSPVTISGVHSVIIPANSLRIYATPPDGSNKGGIADKGAELVLGHFLGASSWTMPTSFSLRCHSADPTRTGNASVSYTYPSLTSLCMEDVGAPFWRGYDIIDLSNATRYWSAQDSVGNTLIYGDAGSGNFAFSYVGPGDAYGGNGFDISGAVDSTFTGGTYNAFRVSFDIVSQPVNGDVDSGTISSTLSMSGTLTPSLFATLTASLTLAGLISVGSTSVAVASAVLTLNAQIGPSAPGIPFASEAVLYESSLTLQTI